jgi:glutamate carboxypeptidase
MEKTPGNEALWEKARATAMVLGIEIDEAQVGGASDGNLTSLLAPTLDGLGAVGDGAHADHEHLVVEKMPERAALLAALLASPVV